MCCFAFCGFVVPLDDISGGLALMSACFLTVNAQCYVLNEAMPRTPCPGLVGLLSGLPFYIGLISFALRKEQNTLADWYLRIINLFHLCCSIALVVLATTRLRVWETDLEAAAGSML